MKASNHLILAAFIILSTSLAVADSHDARKLDLNVGLTTGFTGTNIEVSKTLNDYVSLRADMHVGGSLSYSSSLEGNQYNFSFTPDTKSILVDIHPFTGGFYLTGGLASQNINMALSGQPEGDSYSFNGVTYTASDIGSFTGTARFSNSTAPYLGMGWSNRNQSTTGIAFSFEVGLMDVGIANVALKVDCPRTCTDTLISDVEQEVTRVNNELHKNKFPYPVVKIGISYRF
jgi:hypothetical protein